MDAVETTQTRFQEFDLAEGQSVLLRTPEGVVKITNNGKYRGRKVRLVVDVPPGMPVNRPKNEEAAA